MLYAIFSDIHANADALRRILKDAADCGARRFVCLGDIVGYGPEPAEAVRIVRKLGAVVVAGNHDDAVSGRRGFDDFIDLAADSVERHRRALDGEARKWLASLPYTAEFGLGALAVHGDTIDPPAFRYITTEIEAKANFDKSASRIIFSGHSHIPSLFVIGESGVAHKLPPQDFQIENAKRYIVNPGTVGYPRESDGRCFSSYVLYDSASDSIWFRFLPFAVSGMIQRGRAETAPQPQAPARAPQSLPSPPRTGAGAKPPPRRDSVQRKQNLALFAALAAFALAAAAIFLFIGRERAAATRADAPAAQAAPTAGRAAANGEFPLCKRVELAAGAKCVRANLVLAGDSPKAQLKIAFVDSLGNEVRKPHVQVVKEYCKKAFKIPKKACAAVICVDAVTGGKPPDIDSFSPVAE